ncbi:MAG TPA: outer membrane lipid asymmetry maintenance protein MlaD [Thermodesulfovibrionia bacterium]|nr:outer membrane lipid asymmetry maintenance protein MlaD [Thermodesulfovibrionia bacterium]
MKKVSTDLIAGVFVLIGIAALAYLSVKLGRMEFFGSNGYILYATFNNSGGLRTGSHVEIAGVEVGQVKSLSLDNYRAKVELQLNPEVKLQEDAIASIRTKGLIGETFIAITPGGADEIIKPGGKIRETEAYVSIFELISKYALGSVEK